jgi:scyllo-inositol 2-dehydrogenase (NADP+)
VHGANGSFFKRGLDPQEEQLRAGMRPSATSFGVEPANRWGTLTIESGPLTIESARGTWVQFYERTRNAIENNGPEPVTAGEAALILKVIEAAQRSSREGRRIPLGDDG